MITDWDDAYSNSSHIPDAALYAPRWVARASAYRERLGAQGRARLDLAYGAAERERLDLFLPTGTPKGLFVFVHGGYWMAFDKSTWSHLAEGAVERGWAAALPSYTLAPAARVSEITRQIARAVAFAAGLVVGPLRLSGHSAGGHLVTRLISHTSALASEVADRIEQTISLSGVHDLRPLLMTRMNQTLGMDEAEAQAESAALLRPRAAARVVCWAGAKERPEFVRQNALLANIWLGLGADARAVLAADKHHFDVIDDLSDPLSELAQLCAP